MCVWCVIILVACLSGCLMVVAVCLVTCCAIGSDSVFVLVVVVVVRASG